MCRTKKHEFEEISQGEANCKLCLDDLRYIKRKPLVNH